jgi:KDO2-lipid IV(A) lauroyltransferase
MIYGGKWSEKKIRKTARQVYSGLGKNLFDAVHLPQLSSQKMAKIVHIDPMEKVQKVYDRGNGIIFITAHVGCFEMQLHLFGNLGFRSFAIGRKMFDQRIENLIRQTRSGNNIDYMDRTEGTRKIVRFLKEGKIFGVLIDQDTNVEGVFANFLGRPAHTPSGPIKMAMKLNIPVFVATTVRRDDNTHYVFVSDELQLENTGDFHSDLVSNVQKANDFICKTIEQYPSQWVWMHRRWNKQPATTKPPGETV